MKKDISKLAEELRKELNENIMDRYANSEYYEPSIVDDFCQDNKISENERQKITEILGI